ncbi:MAG: hypothetical protein ACE5FD_15735, partial [Anaerolineae bacterium]
GDPLRQEEGFCYTCHGPSGPAAVDIQAQFGRATHHNVSSLEQADGSKIECVNCHNPHTVTAAAKRSNPDDTTLLWVGSGVAFCQTCHDGAPPAAVSFPPASPGTGYDKSTYLGDHASQLGGDSCRRCHGDHGEDFGSILPDQYVVADYNNYATNDYAMCWRCHSENAVVGNKAKNAFDDLHDKHVKGEDTPCVACHDTHRPHDSGESGLISFDYAVKNGFDFQYIDGRNGTTAFWIDTNQNKGYCYLRCHGKDHTPKDYNRAPADTVTACTGCHGGPQDDGDGVPAGGRRAIVAEFGKSSHHVQGQLQDADCQTCHRERVGNGNHKNDVVELVNADSGANYAETSAGAYRAPTNPTDLSNLTAFCQSCHDADGANGNMAPLSGGQSPPLAGMHANTDFGAPAEANFQVDCIRCHNGHGADNRSLVKTTVLIAGSATAGPVVFTALNGTDSFDEDDGGADADDLCAACHIDAANPGYPMTNHTGGPGHGGGNYAGVQCTTCHLHDADNDPATRDGFMPVPTCIGCHTLPQDDGDGLPAGGRRPVVDEFGNTSHHIQGAAQNSDCRACHRENYGAANHMNDVVQVRHADTGANLTETAPGAFRFPVNPTDISNLTTFCQSCHDGDGAQRLGTPMTPFSDGQTPASVSLHSNIDYSGGAEAN